MTSDRTAFTDIKTLSPPIPVRIANGRQYPATGIGRVHIRLTDNSLLTLVDCLYIPEFQVSLLSVDALNDSGLDVNFSSRNRSCTIRHSEVARTYPWTFVGRRDKAARTCFVYGKVEPQKPEFAKVEVNAYHAGTKLPDSATADRKSSKPKLEPRASIPFTLWHQRFAHLNPVDLKRILTPRLYLGDSFSHPNKHLASKCETCALTKAKVKYQRKYRPRKASRPLELIHSDLCGPISPQSRSHHKYFIIFVDDYTRAVDVRFLPSKRADIVTQAFQDYKREKEAECAEQGYKIARFRCDNGKGEYDNDLFRAELRESNISFEPAPPYTQHKNGVSERWIQTICRRARAMMIECGLAPSFWAEAVQTAVYILNRTPTSANDGRSPYEKLHGVPPRIHHLRRFGCLAYITIPKELQQGKFIARAQKAIFFGYVRDSVTIWRFYLVGKRGRVVEASNAVFDETRLANSYGNPSELPDDLLRSDSDTELHFGDASESDVDAQNVPDADANGDIERADVPGATAGESAPRLPDSGTAVSDPSAGPSDTHSSRIYNLRKQSRLVYSYAAQVRGEDTSEPAPEPANYKAAVNHATQAREWTAGICEELDSLISNRTWDLTLAKDAPAGAHVLSSKWVFKKKMPVSGIPRFKARMVIRGFEQVHGVDYDETFAPVAKLVSLRMLIALAARFDWEIEQLDVVTAFLNPDIDGDIYMEIPDGFNLINKSDKPAPKRGKYILKLRKALYGLKQAPRLWYQHIDAFLQSLGFRRCDFDPNVYISKGSDGPQIILLLYVDDLLMFSASAARIRHFKDLLMKKYRMTDLGAAQQFLGLEIIRDRKKRSITLRQQQRIDELLVRTQMQNSHGQQTPLTPGPIPPAASDSSEKPLDDIGKRDYQSLVGSLMWLMLGTRPDIAFAVGVLSRYNSAPTATHVLAAKHILRYLRHTHSMGITYDGLSEPDDTPPIGYTDSDFAGDTVDRKSTSGYVFTLCGGAVSWRARKQPLVAFSAVEAEYIGASDAAKESIWIRNLYADVALNKRSRIRTSFITECRCCGNPVTPDLDLLTDLPGVPPQKLYLDNNGASQLAKQPRFHERTKHISIRYHFVRDAYERKVLSIEYLASADMTADIMTKSLPRDTHWKHAGGMGLRM